LVTGKLWPALFVLKIE